MKEKMATMCKAANEKFYSQFGFNLYEVSFSNIVEYMHRPKDSSSLAVTRILFGLAMLFDIPDERGGAAMKQRWGNPKTCHFPLLPFVQPILLPYMAIVYLALWLGAVGITLGYKYRISAATFTACYWYLFLIEKSYWNNHSYLFGLVAFLLTFTDAHCYWSIDALKNPSMVKTTVPYWNYFILKYQFFILYFMAGMKKGTAEWLTGYSVQNLSEHWVFEPFRLFLTVSEIDYIIVHWFVFVFDLTIAFWMMYSKTRNIAMFFCAMFHLMNSRLFRIGMFPWVCLATMPLFYPFDWPKTLLRTIQPIFCYTKIDICEKVHLIINGKTCDCEEKKGDTCDAPNNDSKSTDVGQDITDASEISDEKENTFEDGAGIVQTKKEDAILDDKDKKNDTEPIEPKENTRKWLTMYLILLYVATQAFLPYSHFITKGYNNWTNGLYGYSWDMMVHTWDTHSVSVKVVDNKSNQEYYMDPYIYSPNDRWTRHGDMVYQYTRCLKENLNDVQNKEYLSENISIYVDVWSSMNGRFTQPLFDSKVDMLKVDWSPFQSISFLMPLLDDALVWREKIDDIRKTVYSWNNQSDVIFLADFAGYEQNKFISHEIKNASLTILEGEVVYEPEIIKFGRGHSYKLTTGESVAVETGILHRVMNIGNNTAYYMYTFYNSTTSDSNGRQNRSKLPLVIELFSRFYKMLMFGNVVFNNIPCVFNLCNANN